MLACHLNPLHCHMAKPNPFAEEDYILLVDQEEGAAFILDLLDDVFARSEEILFAKHIQRQLVPYTVNVFEKDLLDLIDVMKWFQFIESNV